MKNLPLRQQHMSRNLKLDESQRLELSLEQKRKYVKVKSEAFHGLTTLVFTLPKLRVHESPRNQNEV
jgi:hypothetical protein